MLQDPVPEIVAVPVVTVEIEEAKVISADVTELGDRAVATLVVDEAELNVIDAALV